MKTITTILTVISFFLVYSVTDAQNCQGDNIRVYKGATGCQCHCMKECITPAELPVYLANGWNTEGCWNCCKFYHGGWVDAENKKTAIDSIIPNVEPGTVTIAYTLSSQGDVTIKVADMAGRCVATVADDYKEDLDNELIWDQSALKPGVYFLTLEAGDHSETKMISITE